MKTYIRRATLICLLSLLAGTFPAWINAQNFDDYFTNQTLKLDYIFSGSANSQTIALSELSKVDIWAGRRHHLDQIPLQGNGQIIVRDLKSKAVIYKTSFSSLFQEWQQTKEAKKTVRAFQNTFIVPYPKQPVEVEITLLDKYQKVCAVLKQEVNPSDILIRNENKKPVTPYHYLLKSGSVEDCIDIAILGEGYTAKDSSLLAKDAGIAVESLFRHEPFKSMKNRFNVVLVNSISQDSGISTPRRDDWKNTLFDSHFDTFYSDRYLTTNQTKKVHDVLAGIPYEHIIILANTPVYGGGGIYNAFTLTSSHHNAFGPVVVHEFGHSFGGLADEYFYDGDTMEDSYATNIEPWEQNITTLVNFESKWKDMLAKGTPVPTPLKNKEVYQTGAYEGAAYSAKGIYRGSFDCRMKTNTAKEFCPVCQQALTKLIRFYTDK